MIKWQDKRTKDIFEITICTQIVGLFLFLLSIPILIPLYGYSVFLKDHSIYQGLPYYAQLVLVFFYRLLSPTLFKKSGIRKIKKYISSKPSSFASSLSSSCPSP